MLEISVAGFNITFTLWLRMEQRIFFKTQQNILPILLYFLLVSNELHMFMHDCMSNGKHSKYFADPRILELTNYVIVFWGTALPQGK